MPVDSNEHANPECQAVHISVLPARHVVYPNEPPLARIEPHGPVQPVRDRSAKARGRVGMTTAECRTGTDEGSDGLVTGVANEKPVHLPLVGVDARRWAYENALDRQGVCPDRGCGLG